MTVAGKLASTLNQPAPVVSTKGIGTGDASFALSDAYSGLAQISDWRT